MIKEHPLIKGFIGVAGVAFNRIGEWFYWLPEAVRLITFYGGALVVVLTAISFCLDIIHKWKFRNTPKE